jgi:hypothetical protein
MKSGFLFHDNFGFVRFWPIGSLKLLELSQRNVAYDFMITLGLFVLVNWLSNSIGIEPMKS